MKKIIYTILFTCFLLPSIAFAQTVIRGTIKDITGSVPGVSVQEKGIKGNGTITNENGEFKLTLKGTAKILQITAIGYLPQEVNVAGKTSISITIKGDVKGLEEVVVVGFGTTKKITNTGAISTVSGADIRSIPTPNVQNTLAGRAPGFFSQQRSGQPGKTGSDFYIRGVNSLSAESQKPLVIVDDVEYTYDQLSQIDANEIESFTILKDASTTAVYGIKGANGVVVVTTRRGKLGKPRVSFNTESGVQSAVHVPNFLNAYQVATLKNEANTNDGITVPEFTAEDLEHWRTGDDPYGHPDVDWYNALFKKYAYQNRNNIDITGGSEKIRYFISAGQFYQNGALRDFSKGTYEAPENNYAYERYTFRSNLDMQATKNLKLRLDVTGRIGNTTEPHLTGSPTNVSALSTVYSFDRLRPYSEPLLNPDGSYPWAKRSRYFETSILGRLALQGYDKTYRNEFNILFGADHKLDFITTGLSVSGRIAYAGDVSYGRGLNRNAIPAFYYDPVAQTYTPASNGLYRLDPLSLSGSGTNISNKTVNSLAKIDYNNQFGNHHIYGFVLYNLNSVINANSNSGFQEYAPISSQGYTFKAGYDYKQRYLVDFSGAYNGTSQFVGKKTKGFFPAVSAGWNIAEEPFIKRQFKFLDLLKLRGSWGMTGSDVTKGNNYKTEQVYGGGPGYSFGETNNSFSSIQEGSLGNLNITWEKSRKTDIGIDAQFFGNKFSFTVDYFYDYRYDQLYIKQDVLNIIGVTLPYTNSAITQNKGFDGIVSLRNNIGKVNLNVGFTFSTAKNKILYQGEAAPRYAYLAKTGLPIGQTFGYNALGFFQTTDEVNNYPHLANAKPGDLKYEDINGDGVIDGQDFRAIGKPNLPQTVLGSTFGADYKGFSLNLLFQGSFDYSYQIGTQASIPFQANLQQSVLGRWTPENNVNATYPRLSADVAGPSSPANNSTFWLINAKYVRLKSVDLGYRLPQRWAGALHVATARIYLSGYDLYTWSNFSLYSQDPEVANGASGGTYPVQKVYNLGLQVGF